jgi:DNA polymerase III alpha subunit
MGQHSSRPARDDIVSLVAAGAFDSLPGSPGGIALDRASRARILLVAGAGAGREGHGQASLFETQARPVPPLAPRLSGIVSARKPDGVSASVPARRYPVHAPDRRRERELRDEFGALGFLRDSHPLVLWASKISDIQRVRGIDIPRHVGRDITLVGWPVTQKEVLTSGGQAMDFVSLEDETALYETVFFPDAYARFRHLLLDQRPLVVTGTVADDQGALSVVVKAIRPMQAPAST